MTVTLLVVETPAASVIVTTKLEVPAAVKVAVVFLAAFEAFALKLTGAGTVPVVAHVYVSVDSPSSCAPRTLSAVVVPFTVAGQAAAGEATVSTPASRETC